MEALYLDLDDLKQSKSAGEKEWESPTPFIKSLLGA